MSEDERSVRERARPKEQWEQWEGGGMIGGIVHLHPPFYLLKQLRSGMPSPPPLLAWGAPQHTCSLCSQIRVINQAFLSDRCTVTLSQAPLLCYYRYRIHLVHLSAKFISLSPSLCGCKPAARHSFSWARKTTVLHVTSKSERIINQYKAVGAGCITVHLIPYDAFVH